MTDSKTIGVQLSLEDTDAEYKAFVDKFKPKKTTDDCYTPPNIYEAVKDWVCNEYGVNPDNIVRPFWPGGDYERFPYKKDSVVVDNPPFSIISKIATWYANNDISFFLFAPYLTNLSIAGGDARIQHVITQTSITYENGANVATAFITNMDKWFIRSVPVLAELIETINKENLKKQKRQVPKYSYPDEVLTSADVGYLCKHGIEIKIPADSVSFIRSLESQRPTGKTLFGAGYLLSERAAAERAAAERAAAERAAAERAAAIRWKLSEAERNIVSNLTGTAEWSAVD